MIGDNPDVDIKGGNSNGYITILVKTGVFKGNGEKTDNSSKHPANYCVENISEAVKLILDLESL